MQLNIKGIMCDNSACNYRDDSVQVSEYKDWLNKPCPQCGANLLTKADFKNIRKLIGLKRIINFLFPWQRKPRSTDVCFSVKMDGSGNMDIQQKK